MIVPSRAYRASTPAFVLRTTARSRPAGIDRAGVRARWDTAGAQRPPMCSGRLRCPSGSLLVARGASHRRGHNRNAFGEWTFRRRPEHLARRISPPAHARHRACLDVAYLRPTFDSGVVDRPSSLQSAPSVAPMKRTPLTAVVPGASIVMLRCRLCLFKPITDFRTNPITCRSEARPEGASVSVPVEDWRRDGCPRGWHLHRAPSSSRTSSIALPDREGSTVRNPQAMPDSEPYASTELGGAPDGPASHHRRSPRRPPRRERSQSNPSVTSPAGARVRPLGRAPRSDCDGGQRPL